MSRICLKIIHGRNGKKRQREAIPEKQKNIIYTGKDPNVSARIEYMGATPSNNKKIREQIAKKMRYDYDCLENVTLEERDDGAGTAYAYDSRGNRVRVTDALGETVQELYYYQQDEQLSTALVIDGQGGIQNRYLYDALGVETEIYEQLPNRIRYTGQQYDELTEQYYLRARYYNLILGRFMQEDSYQGDGLNLYAYCGNNPVVYYDPSGYNRASQEPNNKCGQSGKIGEGKEEHGITAGEIADSIPKEYKQMYTCKEFADEMQSRMEQNGMSGERINVNGIIYDNLNSQGISHSEWKNDLGIGNFSGIRELDPEPF